MVRHKPLPLLSFVLIAITTVLIGCEVTDNGDGGTAQMTVQLTDAPGDYDAVWIDIQSVRVHLEEDIKTEETETDEEAEEDGWITLNEDPVRVNLLELRNGNTIQIGDEEIKAGEYHQIRLILGNDNEVVVNGESYALTTPSAQQSGLKLNLDAEIEDGEVYNLLIDFDAGRSIVETGNGKYILKPVLRAVNLEETGSISGTVEPIDVQTSVRAVMDGDTLSTLTANDGTFSIIGVNNGTYDVEFVPNSDSYTDTTIVDITVEESEDVELGTITLPD